AVINFSSSNQFATTQIQCATFPAFDGAIFLDRAFFFITGAPAVLLFSSVYIDEMTISVHAPVQAIPSLDEFESESDKSSAQILNLLRPICDVQGTFLLILQALSI
ncbi:hypothetical protein ACJX0J_008217, partial [Zea mays]